ncbi:MAG: GlsB/YeaQ/YmgE family stress response membrane protein, partial [Betaproteobacteria bacterium]|nr:GlsB/YeaQ/YmgE family stress response membrane protein [Betaproteobacteria bacterium]
MGEGFIGSIVIGLLAGWLGGKIMRGGGFGLIGNLIVGVIGAVIG